MDWLSGALLAFLGISALVIATPGPDTAITIRNSLAGGRAAGLATVSLAEQLGLRLMVGCMVATSLAMAPAILVAQRAHIVDLDGALLLARESPLPAEIQARLAAGVAEDSLFLGQAGQAASIRIL